MQIVFFAFVLLELVLIVMMIMIALQIGQERRRIEISNEIVYEKLDRIERLVTTPDRADHERRRQDEFRRKNWEKFYVYGIEEGT